MVILCESVGYRAAVSAETLRHVPSVGEQVTLHAHLIVRDDNGAIADWKKLLAANPDYASRDQVEKMLSDVEKQAKAGSKG